MQQQLTIAEIRRELAAKGIRSEKAMYEKLPGASKRLRLWGIIAIENRPSPSAVPLLADFLYDAEDEVRMAAASALAKIGGRAALHMLAGILEIADRAPVRHAAVYGLAFMFEDEAFDLLMSMLSDLSVAPATRGLAAEGIANLLEHSDPREGRHKEAVRLLIVELDDRSPQVRFWAAFALGRLGAHQAIPNLKRLAETDKAVCQGWWSVAKEANDAISAITGEEPNDQPIFAE